MTVTTIQIHPLLTGNASLTAHLDIRSVYDILPDIDMSTNYFTSLDKATHFLNHAPVFLRYENGGEELLNRDCIKEQLNLDESLKSPLPQSLYVFIIEEHDLKVSTRVIRFVYAQLQILMYRKTDGNAVDLRKKAVDELANNSELNASIAREFFDENSLKMWHYKKIFAAANLKERRIRSLVKESKKDENVVIKENKKDNKSLRSSASEKVSDSGINGTSTEGLAKKVKKEKDVLEAERKHNAEYQLSMMFEETKS